MQSPGINGSGAMPMNGMVSMMPMQGQNGPGMGISAPQPMLPIPQYPPETIRQLVKQAWNDNQGLRTRMEGDYAKWKLDQHVNRQPVGRKTPTDWARYTSNGPRTFGDKVITWTNQALFPIRVPHFDVKGHPEEADNLKEQFAIGCLAQADERLTRTGQPTIGEQLSFNIVIRGGYIGGRVLLVKRPDGTVYADVQPFDPMHTSFEMGPDGPEWVCHTTRMTRRQIRTKFGVELAGGSEGVVGSNNADVQGVDVYDFYDGFYNTILTDGDVLKPPTPHGSPRVPCALVLVGSQPLLHQQGRSDMIADVGESIYASVRGIINEINETLSIVMELAIRTRGASTVWTVPPGTKVPSEDIRTAETDVVLPIGSKVEVPDLNKIPPELLNYLQFLVGEWQRGTIPFSSFGELQFQLSGYAINSLKQGIETVLHSRLQAKKNFLKQAVDLFYDQFMTAADGRPIKKVTINPAEFGFEGPPISFADAPGQYDGMQLSGRDKERKYFRHELTAEQLLDTCDLTVDAVSQLPQDDLAKWNIAQIAKTLGLYSHGDILDKVLNVQDVQQALDKVMAEKAEAGLPEATLFTLYKAEMDLAADPNDPTDPHVTLASMYKREYDRFMMVKLGVIPDTAPGGGPGQGGGQQQPGGPKGMPPQVMPNAATGAAPEPETSNNGPARVAPGTPRPRAQGQPDQDRQP